MSSARPQAADARTSLRTLGAAAGLLTLAHMSLLTNKTRDIEHIRPIRGIQRVEPTLAVQTDRTEGFTETLFGAWIDGPSAKERA